MFKELRILNCRVSLEGNVAGSSLKKLSIANMKLSDDVIERILVGSPMQEVFDLDLCQGFSCMAVTSSRVKKLVLSVFLG